MAGLARHPRGEGAGARLRRARPTTSLAFDPEFLRPRLDRLVAAYGPAHLARDPLSLVRRYRDPRDREVAGLVASGLAFGGVRQVLRSAGTVLEALGPRPARAIRAGLPSDFLAGFRHRWISGEDVRRLLLVIRRIFGEAGTVEAFFAAGPPAEPDRMGPALDSFSRRAKALAHRDGPPPGRGFEYFFPEPSRGGAAKRLCLFLRWMARPDDGLDLGVWRGPEPAALVLPLDVHVARIVRYVGLSARRSAGWKTALDATAALRRIDPCDPVRYDFALAQLGISRGCLHRRSPDHCPRCPLDEVCRL